MAACRGRTLDVIEIGQAGRVVPGGVTDRDEAFSRALAAAGRFDSVTGDVADRHDEIAGEADW